MTNTNLTQMIVTELVTVNVNSPNYYADGNIDISKDGYTPIGVVGHTSQYASYYFYTTRVSNNKLMYGISKYDHTGNISNVNFYFDIIYIKNL